MQSLLLGRWLGRHEAFSLIARKCSAAEAHCLKTLRDQQLYKELGVNWETFCRQEVGVSHQTADRIIHRLEEFGAAYFKLAEVMQISAEAYRRIAAAVTEKAVEFDGEKIPVTPENAPRIVKAVRTLQRRFETSQADLATLTNRTHQRSPEQERQEFVALRSRLDTLMTDLTEFSRRSSFWDQKARFVAVLEETAQQFENLLIACKQSWRAEIEKDYLARTRKSQPAE